MLDAADIKTVRATRLLFEKIGSEDRRVALWIGAGASSWCGYSGWGDLASSFHTEFQRYEPDYNADLGLRLIKKAQLPELFQECKNASAARYNDLLSANFSPRSPTPVYSRFIQAIRELSPAYIITTNVDDLIEKNLPTYAAINRMDIERCTHLLNRNEPFVCKLHGSMDNIESVVFTSDDYANLINNSSYLSYLERLTTCSTVIFVGYGLQDDYLVSLLHRSHKLAALFGDGPHFALLPNEAKDLPASVKIIRYIPEPHKDHRSSISVIEELKNLRPQKHEIKSASAQEPKAGQAIRSAHLLYDVFPPGTWKTSQTIEFTNESGDLKRQAVIGNGFTTQELAKQSSTAMHDLLVGLLCFDQVIAPIQALGRLHNLVGSDRFWALVREDIVTFINWSQQEAIIFPGSESIASGCLASLSAYNPDKTKKSIGEAIRNQLKPTSGREEVAERLFAELEPKIHNLSDASNESIPSIVSGLLLRPSIRDMLGISGGTPLTSIARWQVFSVLRLATVVRIGAACRDLHIGSAKLDFGTSNLAGPAFSSVAGNEWTDDSASYVICGRFGADLGRIMLQDTSLIDTVIAFRDTEAGIAFRQEVFANLATSNGAEVNIAVNSALSACIPSKALQAARDQFVGLFMQEQVLQTPTAAIWNDERFADKSIIKWKQASRKILEDICRNANIKPYDPCPCGSGELLKWCCDEALK
ncbi:SIR2 family protein [bacterium AH-315-C08]|nr:SIR2 family protein [bacterium AH-315-C08]